MFRIKDIRIRENFSDEEVAKKAFKEFQLPEETVTSWKVYRKSIDARDKNDVHFVYTIDVELCEAEQLKLRERIKKNSRRHHSKKNFDDISEVSEKNNLPPIIVSRRSIYRPVIVGSGPAGLFAALTLAEHGIKPIVIEQGKKVDERIQDVEIFKQTGKFNSLSNIQFGEGGAGTFSDGKLNSGINSPYCQKVLETFVRFGAPEQILYMNKPHVGTDNLISVVKSMREEIIRLGGTFLFQQKVTDLKFKDNHLKAVICRPFSADKIAQQNSADKNSDYDIGNEMYKEFNTVENNCEIETDTVVLAIGHSSRETFERLYELGLNMEAKSFSIGTRIEHKQKMINVSQYGDKTKLSLPSAEYKLVAHCKDRTLYTFCMCPGGVVVPSTSEEGAVVTNGMSYFARDGENANSAILVGVNPEDFAGDHPLRGMYFQKEIEHKAFEVGGRNYNAPAQRVEDFLAKRKTTKWGNVKPSYLPGVTMSDLHEVLPTFITDTMEEGLLQMDRKLKGFADKDAVLTGVETRSSSPVRIIRDDKLMSNIHGIYPCGEGAGYAGGIMSAAVDGIKVAIKILNN